jgi:hypothetical protein
MVVRRNENIDDQKRSSWLVRDVSRLNESALQLILSECSPGEPWLIHTDARTPKNAHPLSGSGLGLARCGSPPTRHLLATSPFTFGPNVKLFGEKSLLHSLGGHIPSGYRLLPHISTTIRLSRRCAPERNLTHLIQKSRPSRTTKGGGD